MSQLRASGKRAKMTSMKTGCGLSSFLIFVLARLTVPQKKNVFPIRALMEERCMLFRKLFRLWLALDISSVFVEFLVRVYVPIKIGYIVIVEEFIPGTITDYLHLCAFLKLPIHRILTATNLLKQLVAFCGQTKLVFLDADDAELRHRWMQRSSLAEKDDYLQFQRVVLPDVARWMFGAEPRFIDTTGRTLVETHQIIMRHLERGLK
jgi:uncharacterized membrane protein